MLKRYAKMGFENLSVFLRNEIKFLTLDNSEQLKKIDILAEISSKLTKKRVEQRCFISLFLLLSKFHSWFYPLET